MQSIPLVREADATDEGLREAYREIKNSLRVPVVNVLFQAYAATPKFLEIAWRRLRPSVLTAYFNEQALEVGAIAEHYVTSWPVHDHAATLQARAIGPADLARMREIADLFFVVNPKLLIIAHAVDMTLSGEPINGTGAVGPSQVHHYASEVKEFRAMPLLLTEERDAPPRVRAIFEEIKSALGSSFIHNEYRALSVYPDWLEVWWRDCKPLLADLRYAHAEQAIRGAGRRAAESLPHRFVLSDDLLERNGIEGAARTELVQRNNLFLGLLPRLILNMEIARRGLGTEAV